MAENYSVVLVGTGFASSFFLLQYLKHARPDERILVLEWGHKQKAGEGVPFTELSINETPQKDWVQRIAFGGGSCWTGNTPRLHPTDFRTKTLHGVGADWPMTYDDLEPYYQAVEDVMGIAGASGGPYPRSKPYPCPPHRFNALDEVLAKKYPNQYIPMPSARSSDVKTKRPLCCGNGVCTACPIGAKFQIDPHMASLYDDPRITLRMDSEVRRVDVQGGRVTGVQYKNAGREQLVSGDLVVVGAHAIMSPFILLRSGLTDRALGRYLNEQIHVAVQLDLDGVENFDGGQRVTGLGLMFVDGPSRKDQPGCVVENSNVPWLRAEPRRWRQRGLLKFVFEDLPSFENHVAIAKEDPNKPALFYPKLSTYMEKGLAGIQSRVEELLKGLPIESFHIIPHKGFAGAAHIQGTTRMGTDPADSVVDGDLRHHSLRNLLVLGSGVFPTCPAANPTLTLSALSLRAADRLFS
ncbi:MAG TPA: GMC family oxidoreductase [Polyangiaceae bacterium]|nr:GMC family oxidoreductase [Polyangiaceae bacterium]